MIKRGQDQTDNSLHFLGLLGLFLFLVVMWLCAIQPASAQTPSPTTNSEIQMTVYTAFQGHFKYGEWLPLWVEIENFGPDLQAELQVPISNANGTILYSTPVELPGSAYKRVPIYVLPNNFSRQLTVELVAGEQLLGAKKIDIHPHPNVTFMVGILAPERGAISMLNSIQIPGVERSKILVDLTELDLPEKYEGLRSLDLLIINNTDTSTLTPEQRSAIESWVNEGGRLVLGGGAGALKTSSNWSESLFPFKIAQITEMDSLPGLEAYLDEDKPIRVLGPFVVAAIDPSSGRTLAAQDELPLILETIKGKGLVDFIALDLASTPFDAWNGTTSFWEKLAASTASYPEWLPTDISARQQFASNIPYTLSNLPMLDLPSAKWLALMLGLYILVVGPLNYLVLRRMKRLHYAWLTIPAATILFSAASFFLGYVLHGTDIFINKISILRFESSGSALVDSYIGVFSPAQTSYEIEVSGAGLLSPLAPYYDPWDTFGNPGTVPANRTMSLTQGDPAFVRGLSIDQWSMQSFMSESRLDNFEGFFPVLKIEGNELVGNIENTSTYLIQDAFLIWGNNYLNLGDIPPGDSVEIKLDLSNISQPNFGSSLSYAMFEKELNDSTQSASRRQAEVKRSIIENLFERIPPYLSSRKSTGASAFQGPVFGGWLEEAPPSIEILGAEPAEQTTAIMLAPVSFEFSNSSGIVTIPTGVIPGTLKEIPRDGGTCGSPGAAAVYMGSGQAAFEFSLPVEALDLEVKNLKLALWTDSGVFITPTIEIFNWEESDWFELAGVNQGINLIPNANNLVQPDGLITLRLSAENAQSCYFVALGLEGTQP